MLNLTGIDINICDVCPKGRMIQKKELKKYYKHPPPQTLNIIRRNIA